MDVNEQQSFAFAKDDSAEEIAQRWLAQLPALAVLQNQLAQIEAIDYFLAREVVSSLILNTSVDFSTRSANELEVMFYLVIALSQSQRLGHTCIPLTDLSSTVWFVDLKGEADNNQGGGEQEFIGFQFPDIHVLTDLVQSLSAQQNHNALVVIEHDSLYLRRYWAFEKELASRIKARGQVLENDPASPQLQSHKVREQHRQIIQQLFPDNSETDTDWQKVAVANALNKPFSIIAGGPGTGKTYTVTKLIAALVMQSPEPLDIQLVAPTGKAAQRLSESIANAVAGFADAGLVNGDVLNAIPKTGLTIHRLLGVQVNNPNFRHDNHNPLHCDVVIVDEVSMVDLPLMTRLFRALPLDCKVVLLGDCQQLPSVETGSVLADLAMNADTRFSENNIDYLAHVTGEVMFTKSPHCDYLTYLTKSRRFQGSGGIGRLAQAMIAGDSKLAWQLVSQNTEQLLLSKETSLARYIEQLTEQYYLPYFSCDNVEQAFEKFQHFRILSPCRSGEGGIDYINEHVEGVLQKRGLIQYGQSLYRGRVIMITQNHYKLGLFNGDIGMLWPDSEGQLKAYFPEQNGFRQVSVPRLPPFETVYGMTIHKTQGSEFDCVAMILPQTSGSRLLSRELLYTGLTRAKSHFQLYSRKAEFIEGIETQVRRCSALGLRLQ